MILRKLFMVFTAGICAVSLWAASDFAPAVPDLTLPEEPLEMPEATETIAQPAVQSAPAVEPAAAPTPAPVKKAGKGSRSKKAAPNPDGGEMKITTADIKQDLVMVQQMNPTEASAQTNAAILAAQAAVDKAEAALTAENKEDFVPARETSTKETSSTDTKKTKVSYNPSSKRDPTLSPTDLLLLKRREEERLRAIEMEKQRRLEAEKRRLAELEKQRQLELERMRDPSREIRGRIHVSGIIGQEVFIGNKVYTVGKTVLGARIISVQPDAVEFLYKGQKFTKKVKLK